MASKPTKGHDPSPGRNAEPQEHNPPPTPGGIRPVASPTISPTVEEHREFPLELVLLLCNQGKFSEAEELTARWIARAEDEYEKTHGAHSGR